MRNTDFKVGDLVRIRDWNDMANEFGENPHGAIKCQFLFIPDMMGLCGREFVITRINIGIIYGLKNCGYNISADMIEHVKNKDIEETEEFEDFLGSIKIK